MQWPFSSSTQRRSEPGPRLLDGPLLAALQGLSLPTRRARGAVPGQHPGAQAGRGEDFFQHRGYVRGEDLRAIDWRASARTGHLLVKERHRPLRQPLLLLLDLSASMDFPPAPASKALCARRLAAALTTLALRRGDPVTMLGLAAGGFRGVGRVVPQGRSAELAEALASRVPACAGAEVAEALSRLPAASLPGSHVVLISDLYGDEARLGAALSALVRTGAALTALHVLSAAERILPAASALEDAETGEEQAIAPGAAADFAVRVGTWVERLREGVVRAGAEWVAATPDLDAGRTLRRWLGGAA